MKNIDSIIINTSLHINFYRTIFCTLFFITLIQSTPLYSQNKNQTISKFPVDTTNIDSLRLFALNIHLTYPDSSEVYANWALQKSRKLNDTIRIAKALNVLGIINNIKSRYEISFSRLNEALNLLKEDQDNLTKSALHNNQGNIYDSFRLYDAAEKSYQKSLYYLDKVEHPSKREFKNHSLFNLAIIYKYKGDYEKALKYINKAISVIDTLTISKEKRMVRIARGEMEKGILKLYQNKIEDAEKLMLDNYKTVENSNLGLFISEAYLYLGKLYNKKPNYSKANYFLKKAISLTKTIGNEQLKIDILEELANTSIKTNNYKEAYRDLEESTSLKNKVFGAQNTWKIQQVNEQYAEEKRQQEKKMRLQKEENEKLVLYLYLISSLVILIVAFLYFRRILEKFRKRNITIQNEKRSTEIVLNKTKNDLELKNKELVTAALQTIERGELLQQVKTDLKKLKVDAHELDHKKIDRIYSSIDHKSNKNWDTFKIHFEQIHSDFFKTLKQKHPKISATEMKLSAFLKLDFSSKDISNMMGISNQSVKMNRYRLRKKLELKREQNLVDFIKSI